MKLNIMGLDEGIEFNDYSNTVLIIKEPKFYSHVLKTISTIINDKNKTNEIVLLDDKDKNILPKSLFILNPFELDLNSKPLLKAIYTDIQSKIIDDGDLDIEFKEHIQFLNKIIESSLEDYNLDFDYDQELLVENYLKAIGLKVVKDMDEPLYNTFINYLELISELLPDSVLIIANCLEYFEHDQIVEICKYKNYKHLNILFIESYLNNFDEATKYIIDEDLFQVIE